MQPTSLSYKLIKKIKDDRFDEEQIHQYHLLVAFSTRDVQVLVIEPSEKRVLLLEDYVLPAVNSHTELRSLLAQLFDAHALLSAGFWNKITISVKNQKFIQVPQALFLSESLEDYLKFNAFVDEGDEVLAAANPLADAVTIFAINRDLKEWLLSLYPSNPPTFIHQSGALIEGVLSIAKTRTDNPLYIYVDRFKLHILYCPAGKLIYYNQFAIKQFADYVKYIMLVMKSLDLNQLTSQVVLWGYIGKNSPHYQEFYKYINNVTFGDLPRDLQFGYMFDEIQEHHFFDTYSIHLLA